MAVLKNAVKQKMGCFVGTEITSFEMKDEKLWSLIPKHFQTVTFGNELKPETLFGRSRQKCPGIETTDLNGESIQVPTLDFSVPEQMLDKIMSWNEAHKEEPLKVRGHVLVWHAQTPEWFFHEDYEKTKPYVDKECMNKRLEWYIRSVLTHFVGEGSKYKDLFYGWDVVNEAVSDETGTYRSDHEKNDEDLSNDTHGSNSSWWHVYESNEYILNAFLYANKYAPATLELYYNDYNEFLPAKMKGIVELLKAVKALQGAPGVGTRISAMGMQGHYHMDWPETELISEAIRTYAEVVEHVQITELDLKANKDYDASPEAKKKEYAKQAERYAEIYKITQDANEEGGNVVTGIIFWGVADHYSWLQFFSNVGGGSREVHPQCPLLFDDNYEPKPAYYVFADSE